MAGNTSPAALADLRGEVLACLLLQTITLDRMRAMYGLPTYAESKRP